jgi:hypothetical protein
MLATRFLGNQVAISLTHVVDDDIVVEPFALEKGVIIEFLRGRDWALH